MKYDNYLNPWSIAFNDGDIHSYDIDGLTILTMRYQDEWHSRLANLVQGMGWDMGFSSEQDAIQFQLDFVKELES